LPSRDRRRRARRAARARARRTTPRVNDAERRLLELARDIAALDGEDVLDRALERLGPSPDAHAGPRPAAGAAAKSRALALAWAREQARLALRDVLERAVAAGAARRDLDPDMLAWLLVAASEALAREPMEAVPDRRQALAEFVRGPG
jgi:hypothetical protein